MKIRPGGA